MSDETTADNSVARRLEVNEEHWCFGCGGLNPFGLHLAFFEKPDSGGVYADWTPGEVHQGYAGMAHGGIISSVLDEVMGWALSARGIWAVTARLDVSFRKPVEISDPLRARAWIERDATRKLDLRAELRRLSDDQLMAEATGIFVRVPEERARDWQARYLARSGG